MRFNLNTWQDMFIFSDAKDICLAGEFGSGKTTAAILRFNMLLEKHPGIIGVILRNFHPDLDRATIPDFLEVSFGSRFETPDSIYYNRTKNFIRYPNGSEIWFMALDRIDDIKKLKNVKIGLLWADQAEEIDPIIWSMACGRVRQAGVPNYIQATCNPEGGDHYLRERYFANPVNVRTESALKIIREAGLDVEVRTDLIKHQLEYGVWKSERTGAIGINPKPLENRGNLRPDYYSDLIRDFPNEWVIKYVFSSWIGRTGMVYNIHPDTFLKELPFRLDHDYYERFDGMDFGISDTNPMVYLTCLLYDGVYYLMNEMYQFDSGLEKLASYIQSLEFIPVKPTFRVGCPRTFQRESSAGVAYGMKLTPAQILGQQFGVHFDPFPIPLDTRQPILQALFDNGKIKVVNCPNLQNELNHYRWSTIKRAHNHAIEAMERMIAKHALYYTVKNNFIKKVQERTKFRRAGLVDSAYFNEKY
jgi:hypothetical protein